MISLRSREHPSRNSVILFLGVAAVSVAMLVWMGMRLVRQDRALEAQRLEDRREAAADRLIASLEKLLSAEEERLDGLPGAGFHPPEEDVVYVFAGLQGSAEFRVWP